MEMRLPSLSVTTPSPPASYAGEGRRGRAKRGEKVGRISRNIGPETRDLRRSKLACQFQRSLTSFDDNIVVVGAVRWRKKRCHLRDRSGGPSLVVGNPLRRRAVSRSPCDSLPAYDAGREGAFLGRLSGYEQARTKSAPHPQGEVLFDRASRGRYSTDASIYQIEPVGVVIPRDEADLGLAVDIARDAKAAILPRGAGTSQCGQTVGEALVIDCSKYLREIVGFDKNKAQVTVQPGVVLDQLNAWLKPHGLWYPVDVSTSAQCTLGGMAGNNSCGSRSIRYGNMVHNVASIDALLANGQRGALRIGPAGRHARGRARDRRQSGGAGLRRARRDRAHVSARAAPGRRLQPRHLLPAVGAALHDRQFGEPRASAGRAARARWR